MAINIEVRHPTVVDIKKWHDDKLYETSYETKHSGSLLKLFYSRVVDGSISPDEHLFVVAHNTNTNKDIGILLIESIPPYSLPMFLANFWRNKTKIRSKINKSVLVSGFLQVYVKPAYRNKGIATKMIEAAELEFTVRNKEMVNEEVLFGMSALSGAFDILRTKLKYCFVTSAAFYKGRHCSNIDKYIDEMTWDFINRAHDHPSCFLIEGQQQFTIS